MKTRFSIIVPVFNEATIIGDAIGRLNALDLRHKSEIIIVDGHPSLTTVNGIHDTGIVKVASPKGRGVQMNRGATVAGGDILLFLHGDTRLENDALHLIDHVLQSETVIGGAFDLGIGSERLVFRIIERMASLRSRITRIPYGDQAIFLRRDFFHHLGGYKEIPIMEDVDLMERVKTHGGEIEILNRRVHTSSRRWETEGILYCTLRNWLLITLYKCGVAPFRLARFYKS